MIRKKELLNVKEGKISWNLSSVIFRIPSVSYIITTNIENINDNKLLVLNFYEKENIEAGKNSVTYKIFIMNDDYISLSLENNLFKWYTGSINKLRFLKKDISYNAYVFFNEEDERNISEFFNKTYEKNIGFALIANYQNVIMKKRLKITHNIIKEKINNKMKEIVSLPSNFNHWICNKVFDNRRYLFYKKIKKNDYYGLCPCCQREVHLEHVKHNNMGICPLCGKEIFFKAIGLSKRIYDYDYISFIHKTDNEIVIRYFYVSKSYIKNLYNPEVDYFENYRVFINIDSKNINFDYYEYSDFKNTGKYRWCRRNTPKYYKHTNVYPYNLEDTFKNTKLKYFKLGDFFENIRDINLINCIISFLKQPMLEYFIKLHLYNIVKDIVCKDKVLFTINFKGKTLKQILGITKEHLSMLHQIQGGEYSLYVLQLLAKNQIKFTISQFKLIYKVIGEYYIEDFIYILKYTSVNKALSYLNKQLNNKIESYKIELCVKIWKDYINDCETLDYNLYSSLILFPKNLKEKHNGLIYLIETKGSKKLDKIINEREEELKEKYYFSYNNLQIMIPKSSDEIIQEGKNLSHCVGSISYLKKIVNGEINILFIRNKDEVNKSFYTVEIKDERVIQCYGYENKIPSKDIKEFLEKWVLFIKKEKSKNII